MRSPATQNFQTAILGVILAVVTVVGLNSFVIITPGQAGVINILGKAQDGALLEGIHFKPPLVSNVDI